MSNENLVKWELIKNLDLSKVKEKLRSKKGFWWRLKNNVDKLEAEYRQFLYLAAINLTEVVVPWTQNLDDFWHEHILDTAKYAKDCETIFGKMFHHNPHLPVGTTEQVNAFNKTKEMYKESFGEKAKAKSDDPGCSGMMFVPVFCGGGDIHHSETSHSHDSGSHDSGSHSGHDGGHSSDSGSHSSCGGSSGGDSGGSSCGGGGGGCGGGGD